MLYWLDMNFNYTCFTNMSSLLEIFVVLDWLVEEKWLENWGTIQAALINHTCAFVDSSVKDRPLNNISSTNALSIWAILDDNYCILQIPPFFFFFFIIAKRLVLDFNVFDTYLFISVKAVLKKRDYGTKYMKNNFITGVRAMNEFCLKPRYGIHITTGCTGRLPPFNYDSICTTVFLKI